MVFAIELPFGEYVKGIQLNIFPCSRLSNMFVEVWNDVGWD